MCQAREGSYKVVTSISLLALVRLLHKMIVVLGLPLIEANIILSWIFSMLFRDFKAEGLRSIPTLPMVALTDFFKHNLPQISLLHWIHGILVQVFNSNQYSCTHMMSIFFG